MVSPAGQRPRRSLDRARAELVGRLEMRRPEIEEAILVRLFAVTDSTDHQDVEYLQGLRAAVAAAVGFGLAAVERGEDRSGPVPAAILAQAGYAARNRVGLQVVLRRYAAGYSALSDFLMQEGSRGGARVSPTALYRLQRELTALFDRLIAAVSAEYEREASGAPPPQRLAERVKRLLAGELVDTSDLAYDFDAWHLGAVITGAGGERVIRELATALDRRLLLVVSGERTVWAWLGGSTRPDARALADHAPAACPPGTLLAVGEPGPGMSGWRLTHRQAESALNVAVRRPAPLTRYADVALLAAILRDDDLVTFLEATYLGPLASERDGGITLRAYFAAGCNASSAGAALGIARQTVTSRLRNIEHRLGRPLHTCSAEIEMALRLADLESADR